MNSDLQTLQRELAHSLHDLDSSQTQLRPPDHPDKWSIQQIAEHLLLTYSSTETSINARLAKGSPTHARPTFHQRMQQCAVTRFGYFSTGREAPSFVMPHPTVYPLSGQNLTQAVVEHLTDLDLLFTEAETLFGPHSSCISHHVLGPLQISQWRRFHLIHSRHHIKQILSLRRTHNLNA